MALIAPTVDRVGDAALTNSIIDKSITEIQDELVADIREHAFYNCTALKKAVFGSVTDVADRAFDGCTALTTVDFHTSPSLGDYAFNNCPALSALILRGDAVCHAVSGTLQNSGIASGNGYIYVPAALLDAYKAHGAWGRYANQIRAIEDYPEICDPYSWETVAIVIENGTYKDAYKIGDSIPVDLGSEGIINMQIAAFDADTLADGSGTAAISWVGKELLATRHRWNPALSGTTEGTGSIGGWEKCELRSYLQDTIKPMIPTNVAGMIRSVMKTSVTDFVTNATQTTADDVWIPGQAEVLSAPYTYKALFPDDSSRKKEWLGGTGALSWWRRDAYTTSKCFYIDSYGKSAYSIGSVTYTYGVCLGFCTGRTPA